MKQLTINPNNKRFYSEDFIKGFECGTQRQLEADRPQDGEFENFDREALILLIEAQKERIGELLADRPQGEWIETSEGTMCSNCHKYPYDDGEYHIANWHSDFCPICGARMLVKSNGNHE